MDEILGQLLVWLRSLSGAGSDLIEQIQGMDAGLRAVLAGLAALLEVNVVTGLLVPGDAIVLLAAAAVASPGEGVMLGAAIAAGAFVGELAGYGLGRWLGPAITRRHRRRARPSGRLDATAEFLRRRGGPAILGARFIPVLRSVMPFVVGLSGFSFRRFVAWSAPACILWAGIFVTVYSLAAAPLRDDGVSLVVGAVFALVGVLLFVAGFVAQLVISRARVGRSPDRSSRGH